ncbi:MAG: hypothetical protein ABI533_01680, partial [Betaproteobacteria bacterium]
LHPWARYADGLLATTMVVGAVFALPVGRSIGKRFDAAVQRSRVAPGAVVAEGAWLSLVFTMSASALAAGTYNPFIYFRF